MLRRFNFKGKWNAGIMACIYDGSLFVLVNGFLIEEIKVQRRLKKEDPLASLLFLIMLEALSATNKSDVF